MSLAAPDPGRRVLLGGALALGGSLSLGSLAAAQDKAPTIDTSPGKHVLRHGLSGVRVGCATDSRGPTGCTVIEFPTRALVVADLRGGAPVTSGPEVVKDRGGRLDAICLAGGSLYGLEAACGVASQLFARRKGATSWDEIALVAGAVIYDFGLRKTSHVPSAAMGRAALEVAKAGVVPLGGRGAGAEASVGKW
ncbi:MAG: P1 family peptidase, partial [Planctomycetes bacterium]|nr:P1 family peptidase [Planctomycetota bacterium]